MICIIICIIICDQFCTKFLGVSKIRYGVNLYWIILIASYVIYITPYWGYNSLNFLFIATIGSYLLIRKKFKIRKRASTLNIYLVFLIFCSLTFIYTSSIFKAILMLLLLIVPVFYYYFSNNAFKNESTLELFLDRICKLTILYFIASLISKLQLDFFSVYPYFGMYVFPCCLVLYLKTRKKIYLLLALLCLSGNLHTIKRTPMIGMLLSTSLLFIYKYKLKAILPIPFLVAGFILSILYIPAVRSYMFFDGFDPSAIDFDSLFSEDTFDLVNTHGRTGMWAYIYEKFYVGHEWLGCGLASVKVWLQSAANDSGSFELLHNDWLEILCETGRIGIGLLLLFYFCTIFRTFKVYNASKCKEEKYISLLLAMEIVSSMTHMFFENCIGGIGFALPFIYLSIFDNRRRFFNKDNHKATIA